MGHGSPAVLRCSAEAEWDDLEEVECLTLVLGTF